MNRPLESKIEDLAYLWDGSDPGWVLDLLSDDSYFIIHKPDNLAILIEDDDLWHEAIRRMLEAGMQVVPVLPDPVRLKAQQQIGEWVQHERLLRELTKVFGLTLAELARQAGLQDIEGAADGQWIGGFDSLTPDEQQIIRDGLRGGTIGPAFGGL